MKPMEFKPLQWTHKVSRCLTSISPAELQNNFGGPCNSTSVRIEICMSHGMSLFAVGIKGIKSILLVLSDIHIPGIVMCLSQKWQVDWEGWWCMLNSIKRDLCIFTIFTLIIPSLVSVSGTTTIISKHILWMLFASSYDLNVFPGYILLSLGNRIQ